MANEGFFFSFSSLESTEKIFEIISNLMQKVFEFELLYETVGGRHYL